MASAGHAARRSQRGALRTPGTGSGAERTLPERFSRIEHVLEVALALVAGHLWTTSLHLAARREATVMVRGVGLEVLDSS